MAKIIAMSFLKIESKRSREALQELRDIPQIKKITLLTGEFDGILEIEIENMEELYELFFNKIDRIEGIQATNTHVVMKRFENE